MGILMADRAFAQQCAGSGQILDDRHIGILDEHSFVFAAFRRELAGVVNRIQDRQAIFHSGFEVFLSMSGRRMYATGTRFQRDIVGQHHR